MFSQKEKLKEDSSGFVKLRTSPKINSYLEDTDFLYDKNESKAPQNLFQRIWYFIVGIISEILYRISEGGNIISFIFYGIMLAALVFVIMKLLELSPHNLLIRSKVAKSSEIPVFEEDIFSIDIDKIIEDAISDKNYRKAVRYLYIKLLKLLTINEIIEWKPEKTNKDYKAEMKKSQHSKTFGKLTKIFEYVWYGEFEIKENKFLSVLDDFESFYGKLK